MVRQDVAAECSKCTVRVQRSLGDCQDSKREQKEKSLFCRISQVCTFWEKTWGAKTFLCESKYELNVHDDAQKVYYFLTKLLQEKDFLVK